jgi:hypothetical protein
MLEMDHGREQPSTIIAWSLIEPYRDMVSIYDGPEVFLAGFSKLPSASQHLFAANWCDYEICNGGFSQFFTNSTGVLAPEALNGFRAIGAHACAEVLEQAMHIFEEPYPRDREAREEYLASLCSSIEHSAESDPFQGLDSAYYSAGDREQLYSLMDSYAQQHTH